MSSSYGRLIDYNTITGSSIFNTIFLNKNAKRPEIIYADFKIDGGTIKFENPVGSPLDTDNILTLNTNKNVAISNVKLNDFADTSDISFLDTLLETSTDTDFFFLIKTSGNSLRYYNSRKLNDYMSVDTTQTITGQKTFSDIRQNTPTTSNKTDLKVAVMDGDTIRPATQTIVDLPPISFQHGLVFRGRFEVRSNNFLKPISWEYVKYSNDTLYEWLDDPNVNNSNFRYKLLPEGWYELTYMNCDYYPDSAPDNNTQHMRMAHYLNDGTIIEYAHVPYEFCKKSSKLTSNRGTAKAMFHFNPDDYTADHMSPTMTGTWHFEAIVMLRRVF